MVDISRFKKVLAPVDGSKGCIRAVDAAISIAKKYDSWLTALYVVQMPFGGDIYSKTTWYKEFAVDIKKESRKWLEEIEKKGEENKVEIKIKILETTKSIPSEIVRYAEVDKTDLIVIGSKGMSGIERLLLGSVSSSVIAHAPCSVMVVR